MTKRVRGTCGTALDALAIRSLWHGPVNHRPPAMLGGLPSHQPSSSHHAAPLPEKRQDGWVEPSPLCGVQDPPAPRRSQACVLVAILCWGVEAREAREENPKTDATERWALGVLQRGISELIVWTVW